MAARGRIGAGARAAVCALLAIAASSIAAQSLRAEVPIPEDYRMDHYRAPTPTRLPGAAVVTAEETAALAAGEKAWLVFVEAAQRSTAPPHPWLVAAPKTVIPGSRWLPNIGKGALTSEEADYFKTQLDAMRAEKPHVGFLFYCYVDCWASWNAARRALRAGYAPIYWYPGGIDGWISEGRPTAQILPAPSP